MLRRLEDEKAGTVLVIPTLPSQEIRSRRVQERQGGVKGADGSEKSLQGGKALEIQTPFDGQSGKITEFRFRVAVEPVQGLDPLSPTVTTIVIPLPLEPEKVQPPGEKITDNP
jgi:hypothetical protein